MAGTFLVDAFNLIHAAERLRRLLRERGPEEAGDTLIEEVRAWLECHPAAPQVVLVFDGPGPPPSGPSAYLQIRYMDHAADEDLRELMERRGRRILVSADGELVLRARQLGCEVMAPKAFYRNLHAELKVHAELAQRDKVPAPHEVAEWLERFDPPTKTQASPSRTPEDPVEQEQVQDWLRYFGEPPAGP